MFSKNIGPDDYFVPMIDARRMEVFTAVYDLALNEVMPNQAMILDEIRLPTCWSRASCTSWQRRRQGFRLDKEPERGVHSRIRPNAADMIALSEKAFRENDFLDLAYSTPNYIKKFHTTTPKKKRSWLSPNEIIMLEYNTQKEKLVLPEYGRNVQQMVDYCLTIENRDERNRCASAIVAIMSNLFAAQAGVTTSTRCCGTNSP